MMPREVAWIVSQGQLHMVLSKVKCYAVGGPGTISGCDLLGPRVRHTDQHPNGPYDRPGGLPRQQQARVSSNPKSMNATPDKYYA